MKHNEAPNRIFSHLGAYLIPELGLGVELDCPAPETETSGEAVVCPPPPPPPKNILVVVPAGVVLPNDVVMLVDAEVPDPVDDTLPPPLPGVGMAPV
jgi:hypothetical protein